MAKVTWVGEDDVSYPHPGPSWTTWQNMRFDKGKPVEITNNEILTKAKLNRFFKVEGGPGRPPGTTSATMAARKAEADDDKDAE